MNWSEHTLSRREFIKGGAAGAVALGLAGCGNGASEQSGSASQSQSSSEPSKLAIVYTNDTHGHDLRDDESLGMAAVAQLRTDWEQKGYEVLVLDCGDAVQGASLVNRSDGKTAMEFMNKVGYDAMALGNHEFDYGQDKIAGFAAVATFPLLSANVIVDETGKTLADPSAVFTLKDGRKVGVFGITTPETYTKVNPLFMKGLTILRDQELYDCAQKQADDLREKGCDLVVCMAHLGEDEDAAPNRCMDVAANTRGIDLFLDGHDHKEENQTVNNADGSGVLILEADCYTHMIGIITWEDGKLEAQLQKSGEYEGQGAEAAAFIQKVADDLKKNLGTVVATTPYLLNGEHNPGVRTEETNLGDLITDAMLWEAQRSVEDTPDLAIINGGAIRESIKEGDISEQSILDVLPFLNYLCTVQVTGAQLLEALEASCFDTPEELGGFPQVSGIEFTIDTSVPYEKGGQYPNSTYYAPANPGSRITIQTINGQPFDEGATYTITSNDFVCAGGDTYNVISKAADKTMKGTDCIISDSVQSYLQETCAGEVPAKYEQAQGRITIL